MKTTVINNAQHENPSFQLLRAGKYFLIILAPLLFLLALFLWQFYQVEHEKTLLEIKTLDSQRLAAEHKLIDKEFQSIAGDLLYLAEQNEIIQYVGSGNKKFLGQIANEYLHLSAYKGIYDQIRFIDDIGREQIRINFNHGAPTAVPEKQLQNKKNRYYFQKSIFLPKGGIFTSPLDLNIEHGKIEYPLKPMIRFGTPVFNSQGRKKGIILLNYQASELLARMTDDAKETYGEFMLVNEEGYWLRSPNPEDAWGFMYPEGQKRVFGKSFPTAWRLMQTKDDGSFFTDKGFFTFKRIRPLHSMKTGVTTTSPESQDYSWIIISHVTPNRLQTLNEQTNLHFLKLFALLTMGALCSSMLITWALMKHKNAEQAALIARQQKEEFMLWRTNMDSVLTQLSANLLAEMSIEEITESVIDKSRLLTESQFAFAAYIEKENGNLVCPAVISDIMLECKLADKEMLVNKCSGLWHWVMENRQPILTNDPANDPRSTGLPAGHIPIRKFLSVPALINDELVGIISLANSAKDYTERELRAINRIATLYALAIQRKRTDKSIHRLLLGTAAVTGKQFFATMVEQLAKCLGTKYVLVGEMRPGSLSEVNGLAFWNGNMLGKPLNYPLADTPCEEVTQKGFCLYEDNIAQLFPADKALQDMNAKFYAGTPIMDSDGNPIGILCALHDAPLTEIPHIHEIFQIFSNRTSAEIERQRAENALAHAKEAAESANNAKSRFLANMSHELRTPLNAIIGFTTVLQEQHFGPLNEKQLGYTNDIRDGGNHLLNSINDILDLAQIEAGKMSFQTMPSEIAILIEQSLFKTQKTAKQRGITINLDIDPDVKNLIIDIDERKIKKVLHNLLSNAIKFTPDDGRIDISMHRQGNDLLVNIADTGIGIAKEDQLRIFEPFYQVKNEYRGKTPGTGLGLPLTKTLVEMHNGTLQVKSEGLNHGTCFTITLPIKESQIGPRQ